MGRQQAKPSEDKAGIVLAVLRDDVPIAEAARRGDVSVMSVARWRDQFLAGGQQAREVGARQGHSVREERLAAKSSSSTQLWGRPTWSCGSGKRGSAAKGVGALLVVLADPREEGMSEFNFHNIVLDVSLTYTMS